jgi:hypothetical protein
MYYSKYPYDDFLIGSKLFDPLKIQLCPLLLPIYWKELNIHGYQISTISKTARLPNKVAVLFVANDISLNFSAGRIWPVPINSG